MKITVLQHTPNEGLGMIRDYAHLHKHELYVYHPYNALHQTPEDIIKHGVPKENKEILFKLLDYLLV